MCIVGENRGRMKIKRERIITRVEGGLEIVVHRSAM